MILYLIKKKNKVTVKVFLLLTFLKAAERDNQDALVLVLMRWPPS